MDVNHECISFESPWYVLPGSYLAYRPPSTAHSINDPTLQFLYRIPHINLMFICLVRTEIVIDMILPNFSPICPPFIFFHAKKARLEIHYRGTYDMVKYHLIESFPLRKNTYRKSGLIQQLINTKVELSYTEAQVYLKNHMYDSRSLQTSSLDDAKLYPH